MGWIEKRSVGYRLVVDYKDEYGKRIRKTKVTRATTKRAAEKELIMFEAEILKNKPTNKKESRIKFGEFSTQWLNNYVDHNLEQTTKLNYRNYVEKRINPVFKNLYLDEIETIQLIKFINELTELKNPKKPAGQATKVYTYRVLRSLFQKAKEWYGIDPNPMDNVPKPKETSITEVDTYTEEESRQIMYAVQNEDIQFRLLITLAFTTGMRRGELSGLEWKNVDLEHSVIHIKQSIPLFIDGKPHIKEPKTKGSTRSIVIPEYVAEELKQYKNVWLDWREKYSDIWYPDGDFLFCNTRYKQSMGKPLLPKTLREKWQDFIKIRNSHIRYIRFHDIRHTSVSILINRGIHAKIISERLGHTKIATTMDVYGHLMKTAEQKAASTLEEVLRVD